jgi:hypothetical protein
VTQSQLDNTQQHNTQENSTQKNAPISTDDVRKLCRKITADIATRQLDEIFNDSNASIDAQIAVTDPQDKTGYEFFTVLSKHLRPEYLRALTESLQTQNLTALDANNHYLKLNKVQKNMIEVLKQQPKFKSLNDTQIIELALVRLLQD